MEEQVVEQGMDQAGLLEQLVSMLGPSSAEAARPRMTPQMQQQDFERRQQALAADQKRKDLLAQLQMQKLQQSAMAAKQRQDAQAQKQSAKDPDRILQALQTQQTPQRTGSVVGGPDAPFSFGQDPKTGVWSFNNLGRVGGQGPLPEWAQQGRAGAAAQRYSTPAVKSEVAQWEQAQRQQASQEQQRTTAGQPVPQEIDAMAKEAMMLKQAGMPDFAIKLRLGVKYPWTLTQGSEQDVAKEQRRFEMDKELASYKDKLARNAEAGKPLPDAVQKDLGFMDDINARLTNLNSLVTARKADAMVGPVVGRTFDYRRQGLGGKPLPGEVEFRQDLGAIRESLLRKLSGAAISVQEADRIAGLLPKETDTPEVFRQGLAKFTAEFQRSMKESYKRIASGRGGVATKAAVVEGVPEQGAAPTTPAAGWTTLPGGIRYRIKQ